MKELDDAGMEKSLREKLASYGRQPSDKVWDNIQQRVARHQKPAPKNRPWLLPLLLIVGGACLLLTGNMLPPLFNQPNTGITLTETERTPVNPGPATTETRMAAQENKVPGSLSELEVSGADNQPARAGLAATAEENLAAGTFGNAPVGARNKAASKQNIRYTKQNYVPAKARNQSGSAEIIASETQNKLLLFTGSESTDAAEIGSTVNSAATPTNQPDAAASTTVPGAPAVLFPLITLEKDVQNGFAASPEIAGREQLIDLLKQEKGELARLQNRADSMLLALGEYVPEDVPAKAKIEAAAGKKPTSRWSAMLSFAPERNFLSLQSAPTDSLMERRSNHETGSSGFNASATVDYRLTDRLSISSGFGYSSYSAELRLTDVQTILEPHYDTVTVTNSTGSTSTQTIWSVQLDSALQVFPVFNGTGQVIGYDSSYIPLNDTTYFTIVRGDTVKTIKQTVNQTVTTREVTTYKVYKPTYHFVTLPVMLRYRLTPGARWWADVAFGAQLQKFTGGTQVITEDGKTFRTERIRASEGPFRQFNVALLGNLALNYGLTEKLSLSVAPAVRYQVQSVYKKETGLKQKPMATGLQFGLRYQF